MKFLVLATNYPTQENTSTCYYIHARNKYYIEKGIELIVLNFNSNIDYVFEDINVISMSTFISGYKDKKFNFLLSHAPNLKNHYLFLKKYEKNFDNIVFFFHGHEVLRTQKIYPPPYKYHVNRNIFKKYIIDIYDIFKLRIWKRYFIKLMPKVYFLFVSGWMYKQFIKWIDIEEYLIKSKSHIVYNCIDSIYEENFYKKNTRKEFDFITIRSNLDGSKYCIDLVYNIALNNPTLKFLIIGKGEFFKYHNKPKNIEWIDRTLNHIDIIKYLDKSKCALMLTRTDAQGVMSCEMSTYGIPLITSDIEVCHEVFKEFKNVVLINNNDIDKYDFGILIKRLEKINISKNKKYFNCNTSQHEISIFEGIYKQIT